ncbi:glycoside hydrolase family 3 N-terminal domain-containing protein [Helcococcus kunzii]|uniref:glycoside hydrolase family 3 N-terminal domain-containing protein n=1 Tax=Helcococcus kunzii TaxID=40091 RepID=UPI0024AE34EF|nr:glycoside hydrolase family 3 N-terminal domain-containing protein [Helcococcus kunzii]
MKRRVSLLLALVILLTSFNILPNNVGESVSYANTDRINEMIDKMSIEQKAGQMIQASTGDITPQQVVDNNIGSLLNGGGDAPKSGNEVEDWQNRIYEYFKVIEESKAIPILYGIDSVHGNNNVLNTTIFPHNISLGQANNPELMKQIGEIVAKESKAVGSNWVFSPVLTLPKNERWGRTYEGFSENKDVVTSLGSAYIEGVQGNLGKDNVVATAKHFAAEGMNKDGIEKGDVPFDYSDPKFQEILNNEVLPPYIEAIKSGVKTIMVTYSSIGGLESHENKALLTDKLKNELGFKGIIISDYNGIDYNRGDTYKEKVIRAIDAGIDMLMVNGNEGSQKKWQAIIQIISEAVKEGSLTEERINDSVYRILKVKEDLGLLDDYTIMYPSEEAVDSVYSKEHRDVAKQAVKESLVLLKNSETENGKSTIMQDLKNMKKIIVAGEAASDIGMQSGGWTVTWQGSKGKIRDGVTIYEGIKNSKSENQIVDYSSTGYFEEEYDAALVVLGDVPYAEFEGDRIPKDLKLSEENINTINNIKQDHPDMPIIGLIMYGRPITIADQYDDFDAIIMAGLPGTEGDGIGEVLLGDDDFKGKLSYTWPWYATDIEYKFEDSSKIMFKFGYGLNKETTGGAQTERPEDTSYIRIDEKNSIIQAEHFDSKHKDIVLENNNTSIGYYWDGRELSYKLDIAEEGKYQLILNAATENKNVNMNVDVYVDDVFEDSLTYTLDSTGGWSNFQEKVYDKLIDLPSKKHIVKFISRGKDFNVDYFKLVKSEGEFEAPVVEEPEIPENEGNVLSEDAVLVNMSSSENSGNPSWYKGKQRIENKDAKKDPISIYSLDDTKVDTININPTDKYQEMLGIGISLEESTINNLMKLSTDTRKEFLRNLVSPDGMGITLIRLTIGTSDFTGREFYTYYDGTGKELNGSPDWYNETGNGFSIEKDRKFNIINVIKELQDIAKEEGVYEQLRFFSSPWTPPGWMKEETASSKSYPNNEKLLKGGKLKDEYINDLAKYFVRYLEEYYKEGIKIHALTLQNEPMLEINYPSNIITGEQEAKLGLAIKRELQNSKILDSNEAKDVKIWAFDHNFDGARGFINDLLAVENGIDSIDGIGFHPYGGSPETMGAMYRELGDKLTMHLTERSVWGTSGANDIITWFRNGAQSYNSWVTMLDSNIAPHQWVGTPDPTMFVRDSNKEDAYWSTPEVYITTQFTKYIKPGFIRIGSTNISNNMKSVAFTNSQTGEIILVVSNDTGQDKTFKVVYNNTQFIATLPKGNVATYRWMPIDESNYQNIEDKIDLSKLIFDENKAKLQDNHIEVNEKFTLIDYKTNVTHSGEYKVEISTLLNTTNNRINILSSGKKIGEIYLTNHGDNTYQTAQTYVNFEKSGMQSLQFEVENADIKINDIKFTKEKSITLLPNIINIDKTFYQVGLKQIGNRYENIDVNDYIDFKIDLDRNGEYPIFINSDNNIDINDLDFYIISEDKYKHNESVFDDLALEKLSIKDNKLLVNIPEYIESGIKYLRVKFNKQITLNSLIFDNYIIAKYENLTEDNIDGNTIELELNRGKFVEKLNKENWNIDLPEGVGFTVEKITDNKVKISLSGYRLNDFDTDKIVNLKVNGQEFSQDNSKVLTTDIFIKAVNDKEKLSVENEKISNADNKLTLIIEGGTFTNKLMEGISIEGDAKDIAKITNIKKVEANKVVITLDKKTIYASDITGEIIVDSISYDDGKDRLRANITLAASTDEPEPINADENGVFHLDENLYYRNQGKISNNPKKGNYVDYYLNIEKPGEYEVQFSIKNDSGIDNGLKLSGGLDYSTDNLATITIPNTWGGNVSYKTKLDLVKGKQTLRFENNSDIPFTIHSIKIKPVSEILIKDEATISANQAYNGSRQKAWGIENKSGNFNIGVQVAGAYQDYKINVQQAGTYKLYLEAANNTGNTPKARIDLIDNNETTKLGEINIPHNGSWDNFDKTESITVNLPKGVYTLRINDLIDGFNYSKFHIVLQDTKPIQEAGWVRNGDNWNYYDKDGSQVKSAWRWAPLLDEDGNPTTKFNWKYFDSKGNSINQIYTENGSSWLSVAGPSLQYHRGWWLNRENNEEYYFRKNSGSMVKGRQFIDNNWMFFRNSGTLALGWQFFDGHWNFADRMTGYLAISEWKWTPIIDKEGKETGKYNWKYFNSRGYSIDQIYTENGLSWLSVTGPMRQYHKGWWTNPSNGYIYFFRLTTGTMAKGEQFINGTWRFFRKSGTMATGWQLVNGSWKFYRIGTGTRVSGRQFIDGKWREFAKDGSLIK